MRISALMFLGFVIVPGCATTISLDEALQRENEKDRRIHEHQRLALGGVRLAADLPPDFIICVQQPIRELRQQPDSCFTLGELRLQRFGRPKLAGAERVRLEDGGSRDSLAPPHSPSAD